LIDATLPHAKVDVKELKKHVGTIHSICWRLLGYPVQIGKEDLEEFVRINGYDKFIKSRFEKTKGDSEESVYSGDIFDMYAWLRNTCTPFDKWKLYPGSCNIKLPAARVPEFFRQYDAYKTERGKIDFSDMLQRVIDQGIKLDTTVLMVDEFQDLTAQMYKIFEMWDKSCDIVVIAGDDNQSIYGFWGGSPEYFNNYTASEVVIHETRRLSEQIKDFSHRLLRLSGMHVPDTKAVKSPTNTIYRVRYDGRLPIYDTEFHLIRCNFQAPAIALTLATEGKVFGGNKPYGWTDDEINIANAIISLRNGQAVKMEHIISIVGAFPSKTLGITGSKYDYIKEIEKSGVPSLSAWAGIIDIIKSNDPTKSMSRDGKLFRAKINGVKNRTSPINPVEVRNRKILTIHGAKGLEADAVFLHTAIPPRIQKVIISPRKESKEEARVWYVGVTRPRKVLYIVSDEGRNYNLPVVSSC